MKRRNAECGKLRRPLKRTKIGEGVYGSVLTYIKFFMVWALVLMADFVLDFRFEYLWPFWLVLRSVYDSFKYQGLAFSIFFVCITITSDVVCYLLIPVQWLFFTASTYVWVQYVWQTERGVCLPTVLLWIIFLYIEVAVRLRDLKTVPFQLDLCRPFAAHCIGYPVITMGFSFKSCISYRFHLRKQREVEKANSFYFELLDQALPSDVVQNNRLRALPASSVDDVVPNGSAVVASTADSAMTVAAAAVTAPSISKTSVRSDSNGWSPTSRDPRPPDDDLDFLERPPVAVAAADDEDSDESGSVPLGGDICRQNGSVKSGAARLSTGGCKELPTSFSLPMGKKNKTASSNLGTASIATGKDYVMYTAKLEADIKRLKAELQSSRCTEQELRSQINSLSSNQRTTKTELSQLRQDNDTLQSKLQKLLANRQQDKQNLATLERQVQEERKGKVSLEQQLAAEKQRRKTDESVAAAARSTARSSECVSEQCKSRRWDLENEIKQLRRELQIRDERTRQLERETQALHQKRGECQSETEVLMSALGAIQDKNAHLETSLSAETRLKLDLFSALGDAKRQLEIQQSLLMHKEMELAELKSKVAEVMAFLPAVTLTSFTTSPVRYSPSAYVSVGHPGLRGSSAGCVGSMEVADQTDATVVMGGAGGGMSPASQTGKSNLNPSASDYTPKITQ